jgi:hypothetical protein
MPRSRDEMRIREKIVRAVYDNDVGTTLGLIDSVVTVARVLSPRDQFLIVEALLGAAKLLAADIPFEDYDAS